jgi:2-methylcitrate dehydratase PrpD
VAGGGLDGIKETPMTSIAEPRTDAVDELATFLGHLDYEALPEDVVDQAKKLLFDAIGVGILGSRTHAAPALNNVMSKIGTGDDALVWGCNSRASAFVATMINASFVHQTELGEGVSRAVVHTSSAVVPAAIAVGERGRVSGRDLVLATAAGIETMIRWGYTMASDPSKSEEERLIGDTAVAMYHGWMTPAMLAPIGTSTVASILRGRSDQLAAAWRFAVNICPTTSFAIISEGSSGKGAFLGIGAANGVLAADLVDAGLEGIRDVFTNWMGQTIPTFDPVRMTYGLGDTWEMTFVLYKHFATIGPIFAPLEAVFAILEDEPDLSTDRIENIHVAGYGRTITIPQYDRPSSEEGARHNLPYCVAEALVRKRRDVFYLDAFTPEEFGNPATWELAQKLTTEIDPDYDALYPHKGAPARVRITLTDGRILEKVADRHTISRYHYPTWNELTTKFAGATRGRLPEDAASEIAEAIQDIERFDDVRDFVSLLSR